MDSIERIKKVIESVELTIKPLWKMDENGFQGLIDPHEKKIIRSNYGDTHYSVGLLNYSILKNNSFDVNIALQQITSILDRIEQDKKLYDYHNDFNLFALCLAYEKIICIDNDISQKIEKVVLNTKDSNHYTINWLPMRIFVNIKRYNWTGEKKYYKFYNKLLNMIEKASYQDGFIADKIPKNLSFNLQYNVATTSILAFLKLKYNLDYDLSPMIGALLKAVLPDGDINYQGRGCNQIFAWGLWVYLLSLTHQKEALINAISYLENRIPIILDNKNIFLNNRNGKDKFLWWDYHYFTVYISHFYMWLIQAVIDYKRMPIEATYPIFNDSGIKIKSTDNYKVVTFTGCKEYLAEKGPVINAIYMKKYGPVWKGGFGPWQGAFGNNNSHSGIVIRNFFGLLHVRRNIDYSSIMILKKINIFMNQYKETLKPLFANVIVTRLDEFLELTLITNSNKPKILNIPVFKSFLNNKIKIYVLADDKRVQYNLVGSLETQYGELTLYQTSVSYAKKWCLQIKSYD